GIDGGVPAALAAAPVAGGAMSECLLPCLAGGRAAGLPKRSEVVRPGHELARSHEMLGGPGEILDRPVLHRPPIEFESWRRQLPAFQFGEADYDFQKLGPVLWRHTPPVRCMNSRAAARLPSSLASAFVAGGSHGSRKPLFPPTNVAPCSTNS